MSKNIFITALKLFVVFTLLTGVAYPALVTLIAQTCFHSQANGSLIVREGKTLGSELIGQEFKEDFRFHSRPSAIAYQPMPSGGSNQGPTSADLSKAIDERIKAGATDDLLYASGSGLDPHISPEGAKSQIARVARENKLTPDQVEQLVNKNIEGRTFGFLGNPRVNVLKLNLDLLSEKNR